jgi:hypothetical protein
MKYVKILGLAAVAAMALMAFLGASSASATVLCTTPNETEGCTMPYPAGTEIHASLKAGTSAELTDTSGEILEDTCTASTVKGTTGNGGSSSTTVSGTTSVLTFGVAGTTPCKNTTTVLNGVGNLEIHWISGTDNGTLTASGFEVTVNAGISCIYGASTGIDLGKVTGGAPATMDVEAVVKKVGGSFLCPSDALWNATYVVTSPHALYVSTK